MNITLTGPRSVGKSTIGKLLAKELKLKYISSDEIGNRAFKKQGGLDKAIKANIVKQLMKKKGYSLLVKAYKKEKNYVFDLSGGSFAYNYFPEATSELRNIAKSKSKIIGLLPSRCKIYSIFFLYNREVRREHFKEAHKMKLFWKTFKRYFRFPPVFSKWADIVVYTRGKTPEQIVNEIKEKLK
ncbi:Shikimate kinase [uncultured archaeon]|nr:Shikimate kinase [uncultured archaeon]